MRIVVTRPEGDASPLRAKLEALGHDVVMAPMLTIVPRPNIAIPDRPWQALAVTSANGIRALPDLSLLKSLPVLTVGPQSLKAARDAGFAHAEAHGGDIDGLARHIRGTLNPQDGPILYLSGAATAGDLESQLASAGFDCLRLILYDAVPATSMGAAADALLDRNVDAVLLYSPRTARIWCALTEKMKLGAEAALPCYLCLSRNVAAVLPETWRRKAAQTPDETAMLRQLEQLALTL